MFLLQGQNWKTLVVKNAPAKHPCRPLTGSPRPFQKFMTLFLHVRMCLTQKETHWSQWCLLLPCSNRGIRHFNWPTVCVLQTFQCFIIPRDMKETLIGFENNPVINTRKLSVQKLTNSFLPSYLTNCGSHGVAADFNRQRSVGNYFWGAMGEAPSLLQKGWGYH